MIRPAKKATWVGLSIIAITLGLLAFIPTYFQSPAYELGWEMPETNARQFASTTRLPQVYPHVASNVRLSQLFKDRSTILVNFWATWCTPCLDELPTLEYLHRQLEASSNPNLPRLVTISVDETRTPINQLFKTLDFSPSFVVLHDSKAKLAQRLGTSKFPETYWINKKGEILYQWVGPQNWLSKEVIEKLGTYRPAAD